MPALEFVVKKILHYMPVLFGFLFLGPLIAQTMDRLGWSAPPGLSTLALGLIVGGSWGLFAFFRGSWIWARP